MRNFLIFLLLLSVSLFAQQDKIFLKDGQILTGKLSNSYFSFSTIYGTIDIPYWASRNIERISESNEILTTVNNEKISGFISSILFIQIANGPKLNVQKKLINKIVFSGGTSTEIRLKDYFVMKNGDVFYGKLKDTNFDFHTSYGDINTSFSSILKIEDIDGQTKILLSDGNTIQGYMNTPFINIESNYGFTMNIPKSSIKIIQKR